MHRPTRHRAPRSALLLALALAAGAPLGLAQAADKPHDPLEKLNRATYAFNDALDRMIARPAARAYSKVVPEVARKGVSNFLDNLQYPVVIINDALQGKLRDAGSDVLRFAVNTVLGVGGIADPATHFGLVDHDEDFGQTLGRWGVPPGPYLVIPVIGPSDFRDAPGKLVDTYTSPVHYVQSKYAKYGLYGLTLLDKRATLLTTDTAIKNAYDPYVFVRNAYLERRNYLVHDGNIPEDNFDDPIGETLPPAAPEPGLAPAAANAAARSGDLGAAAREPAGDGGVAVDPAPASDALPTADDSQAR